MTSECVGYLSFNAKSLLKDNGPVDSSCGDGIYCLIRALNSLCLVVERDKKFIEGKDAKGATVFSVAIAGAF